MRDKDAWTAVMTLATMEYVVVSELNRVGLSPYLAQRKARWTPRGATKAMSRKNSDFPSLRLPSCSPGEIATAAFLSWLAWLQISVDRPEGTIWTASADIISEIVRLENEGAFDAIDVLPGERVRLKTQGPLSES